MKFSDDKEFTAAAPLPAPEGWNDAIEAAIRVAQEQRSSETPIRAPLTNAAYDEACRDIANALAELKRPTERTAITVWKNGGWKLWKAIDAHYAENDPDWLVTISVAAPDQAAARIAELEGALRRVVDYSSKLEPELIQMARAALTPPAGRE